MNLAFKQVIDGRQTYVPEKIWHGIKKHMQLDPLEFEWYQQAYKRTFNHDLIIPSLIHEKIHTIRGEAWDVWKPGKKIHPVINQNTINRFQFAPALVCQSLQKIAVIHGSEGSFVKVDGREINSWELLNLSLNEGYDSVDDFFANFKRKFFYGIIIHWTDLKY